MSVLARFLGGMAMAAFGIFMVIKSEWLLQNFGSIAWAEEHLGLDGGSRLFYKLLGVILCFVGFAIAFGLFGGSATALAPYFGGNKLQ